MSCVDNVCGIGGWTGPKPGDPDNNLTLRANHIHGGIAVSWSYPTTFPHAVAHTLLHRGPSADFSLAVQRAIVAGNYFNDQIDVTQDTEFYYWIQMVSVNGTVMDPIGPASALATPRNRETLESLTGLIDAGALANDLKTSIAGLSLTNQQLYDEIMARLIADQGFADALAEVRSGLTQAMTYVNQEITERQDGDNAIVHSIDLIAAANQDALAAVDVERIARVTADDAMAQQITSLIATIGDDTAGIVHDIQVIVTDVDALSEEVTRLGSTSGDSNAALEQRLTTMTDDISALASSVTTVEASLNGDIATGQVGLIATVDENSGTLTGLKSEFFAKVEVNGLIGGFGILNDGVSVEAGFDVDRFWIGRTNGDKVKPFIISDGIVYMDKAIIRDATIETLHLANGAVTATASAYSAANYTLDGSTASYTVQSLNFSSSGAPAIISFGCYVKPPTYGASNNEGFIEEHWAVWSFAIHRDGVPLYSMNGNTQSNLSNEGLPGTVFFQIQDTPSSGAHTYELVVTANPSGSVNGQVSNRIINILEVKR